MKTIQKTIRPTSILALILCVLLSSFSQSASAAMIATDTFLESDRRQATCDYLNALILREEIRESIRPPLPFRSRIHDPKLI